MLRELLTATALAGTAAPAGTPGPGTMLGGCPVLPASHPLNRDISKRRSILPGLARAGEVAGAQRITHALRMTVRRTQKAYVSPARHFASSDGNPDLPPMGLRLRLKASFDLKPFHGQALVILEALKRYGVIVADNGSDWYITGAPDPRWNDENLHTLGHVPGAAFEAVQSGTLTRG
ncbi:MAG TPA: hypothetical protein VK501_06565 [Baekduia sp.]|uniref:hypothetical protein n=1 Tax=Baekduia sp. TaxID=2600305 RepID=UPI002C02AA7E|nr:hypothetical protein [Baekduia sp.]HMJ33561.1 hypothetical protein [Baekduia sp.]